MNEHLTLPFYDNTFDRAKRRGGGGLKPRENTKEFSEVQVFKLSTIESDFKKDKLLLKPYFDPNLIFKVNLSQKIDEDSFIDFLRRSGLSVISPYPSGIGYWVLLSENENLTEIKRRLSEYGATSKYKEFNAIESFDTIPAEDKIGEQLKLFPLEASKAEYVGE